jgi:hypothetical protein
MDNFKSGFPLFINDKYVYLYHENENVGYLDICEKNGKIVSSIKIVIGDITLLKYIENNDDFYLFSNFTLRKIDSNNKDISLLFDSAATPIYKDNVSSGYYDYSLISFAVASGTTLVFYNSGIEINILAVKTDNTTVILKGNVRQGITKVTLNYDIKSLGVYAQEAGDIRLFVLGIVDKYLLSRIEEIGTPYTSISSFLRIGVIGDSYASGWLDVSGTAKDWFNISWIQQIARMNGVTGVNFSKGGLTTRSWLTDSNGLSKLNSEDACDLYYIALGINDAYTLGPSYLGTIADCTDTPQSNPDTFYGNMGRILDDVATKAPHAKVIISTMAHTGGTYDSYNTALIEIAQHFSIPYIVQIEDSFFTSDYWNNYKVEGHPTVQLYGGMAKAIERLSLKCIVKNASYFNDVWPTSEQS